MFRIMSCIFRLNIPNKNNNNSNEKNESSLDEKRGTIGGRTSMGSSSSVGECSIDFKPKTISPSNNKSQEIQEFRLKFVARVDVPPLGRETQKFRDFEKIKKDLLISQQKARSKEPVGESENPASAADSSKEPVGESENPTSAADSSKDPVGESENPASAADSSEDPIGEPKLKGKIIDQFSDEQMHMMIALNQ